MGNKTNKPRVKSATRTVEVIRPGKGGHAGRFSKRGLGVALFLVLGLFAVYGRMLGFQFVTYDTMDFIFSNPFISGGLTGAGLRWTFGGVHGGYYMPLSILTHLIDCQLYGARPWGHLLGNLLLHTANSLLLLLALRLLTGAFWRSALVAALFAFHPLRVESVAWVVERKELLAAFFAMLTLLAYERYARAAFSPLHYGLVVLTLLLALLSKPTVVTFPFLLLLLDFWPLRRMNPQTLGKLILEKLPLLLLVIVFSYITYGSQESQNIVAAPLSYRLEYIPLRYLFYIGKTFYPFNLVVLYLLSPNYPPAWQLAAALLLLGAITLTALLGWRRRPWLLTGWFWFLGVMVPMIGLVQNYIHSTADRFTYLPQIGLLIAIVWCAAELFERIPQPKRTHLLVFLNSCILVFLILCTSRQLSFWRDDLTLWEHTVRTTRDNIVANLNYGDALLAAGRVDEAMVQHSEALRLRPTDSHALLSLAKENLMKNNVSKAEDFYQAAVKAEPDNYHANLEVGIYLQGKKQYDEAARLLEKANHAMPDEDEPPMRLAILYFERNDLAHALPWLDLAEKNARALNDEPVIEKIEEIRKALANLPGAKSR